ncbi:hypothetical protein LZ554_008931 [Drepanopeziza brunnea f. sp. 'monogermtubi']|nr:hypothetical protein LZ554_008931 [Drepanopeziza brunnea f. sp. 'monogermtubi']
MLLSSLICSAVLMGSALAQVNTSLLLTEFPACTTQCALAILPPANCELTDIRNCLCSNHDLQMQISTCVLGSCNITDQYTSLTVLQTQVCDGVPQPSRSSSMIRSASILAVFTYPIVILRFISRAVIAHRFWWDDYAILVSLVFMIPLTVLSFYPTPQLGMGKHFYNVSPENLVKIMKTFYSVSIIYVGIQTFAKVSILLLYLRIFPGPRFRTAVKIGLLLLGAHLIAFSFTVAFQCTPISGNWDLGVSKHCVNQNAMVYAGAGISIFEDCAIMLLPVTELKSLNLGRGKRVALGFMFALGSFACITSIIRLKYVTAYGQTIDLTWVYVDVVNWSQIETFTAIICACLMCIRPLLMKWMPTVNLPTSFGDSRRSMIRSGGAKLNPSLPGVDAILPVVEPATVQPQSTMSQSIQVTTENRLSYEMKRGSSIAPSTSPGEDEGEKRGSFEQLTKR